MTFFPIRNFINKYWLIGVTILLIVFSIVLSWNQLFSFQFVDEEDNFILGHFLISGEKLYSDLFSHHQPYAYLMSAFLQFIFQPQNIVDLVSLHRIFMIFWSVGWMLILIWRFREKVIIALVVFEIIKYYVLGNLFLSESLAVYPVFYLILFYLSKYKSKKEFFSVGFITGFLTLLLAPLWPFLIVYGLLLGWSIKNNKSWLGVFLLGFIIVIIPVIPFMNIVGYFHNTFYINFKYYIPQSAEEKMPMAFIKALFSPVTLLLGPIKIDSLGLLLKSIWPFFVIGLGGLIYRRKYLLVVLSISFLALLNIRYYSPYLEYKAGFHSVVWLGVFCLMTFYLYQEFLVLLKSKLRYFFGISLIILAMVIFFISPSLFIARDSKHDYQLNYSQKELYGNAIKTMRQPGDTLFVIPDEWLLYFQGDVKNHNRMVNYYGWMSLVWELHDPVKNQFMKDPPAFFFCDCEEDTASEYTEQFQQTIRNGAKTPLWVRKDRWLSLSDQQKSQLRLMNFQLE
jgi:MFS family permease